MTALDDSELLRRYACEQSQAAFAELVRRHLDLVYAAALRRTGGDSGLAQDIAQQAFIALARQARSLERHPLLAGWLYSTARHLAATALRSERARKHREHAHAMHELTTGAPPSDQADASRAICNSWTTSPGTTRSTRSRAGFTTPSHP